MKTKNRIKYLLTIPLLLWGLNMHAQPGDFDAERMNRDINIMENILQEMFKVQSSHGRAINIGSNSIRGTYLPGYGVIFLISKQRSGLFIQSSDENEMSWMFQYSSEGDSEKEVTRESITARMKEFLQDYASTIGQLESDDKVMLIYGAETSSRVGSITFTGNAVFSKSDESEQQAQLPVISAVAKKQDLQAYRQGNISRDQFNQRISISTTQKNEERRLDLEVMANIFETAFRQDVEEKSFRIRGDVSHLKLDNFGAIYFFTINRSSAFAGLYNLAEVFSSGSGKNTTVQLRSKEIEEQAKLTEQERKQAEQERIQQEKQAYQTFKQQLKEYLVDYGRTLKSVDANNHILVSVTINSRLEDIPER
ncbi:MAG: hypothetical protein R3211_05165, partial [Balneolaceae bacterium]|nr:hypothetical protein [Balneolaceae bacterium]